MDFPFKIDKRQVRSKSFILEELGLFHR